MSFGLAIPCPDCGCAETSCVDCTSPALCSNCASCCCSVVHANWRQSRIKNGLRLEYLTLGWMSVEAMGSLGVGLLAGSLALLAFGGDSMVELLSALLVARHLKEDANGSPTPGRMTAQFSSALLMSLVPIIGIGAGYSYLVGLRPESSPLGIAIASVAVLVMPYLWLGKKKIGGETRCLPLQIDAVESATCFLMSLALLGGLLAEFLLGLWWADYLATGVILAFVTREAIESYHESV
jgi:divalent metal cation (Fe/Co/Zn/Cd) transporter